MFLGGEPPKGFEGVGISEGIPSGMSLKR